MFGGMNPKKMQGLMKQMGIKQDEIPAERVVIEKEDGGKVIIENPNVVKLTMQGQDNFQITGEVKEESAEVGVSEEDVKIIVEKTGCSDEDARKTLEKTGDLTEAIMELSE